MEGRRKAKHGAIQNGMNIFYLSKNRSIYKLSKVYINVARTFASQCSASIGACIVCEMVTRMGMLHTCNTDMRYAMQGEMNRNNAASRSCATMF